MKEKKKIYKLYSQSHSIGNLSMEKEAYYSNKETAIQEYKALKKAILDEFDKEHPTIIEKNNNFKLFNGAINSWIEIDLSEIELSN